MTHTTQPTTVRSHIQDDIKAIRSFDDLEAKHINDALSWIDSGADLFRVQKPDVPPKHLVSYLVLVDPTHKSILLVDHIKAQLWLPTGGHVKLHEHPWDAVEREAMEELHIRAVPLRRSQHPFFLTVATTVGLTPGHIDVSLWYLLKGSVHEFMNFKKQPKREFHDIEWFTFDEILESDPVIFDPHLQRFTRKLARFLEES